ncbi:MAG: SDR family oxidoreductase [Ignavibacterium sp.]|nr:SDR family oxidoreductase [Ignavibacterium sp.]MDW8375315.1 SDR family oxidoreductase [Ignavibacteriales bacterium]
MKILITGGSGLLGQYLNITLSSKYEILTLYNSNEGNCKNFNSLKIDLRNEEIVNDIFHKYKPNIVVHSAALTLTLLNNKFSLRDYYEVNVKVTENIAKTSSKLRSRLIYISTDLVYDGNRGSYLTETSKLNPISPYAESKLIGENKVTTNCDDYIILRIALLIGFGLNHSFCHFQSMYKNLTENKPVKLFTDQFRTPISLIEASRIIAEIIDLNIPRGIYNLGGNERLSRYDLGLILAEKINADKNLLIKTKLEDNSEVPNVKDVSMNNSKIKDYGIKIKSIDEMIDDILKK